MNDSPSPNPSRTAPNNGEPIDPIAELRARHKDAVSGRPGTGKGSPGIPRGPRGPYKKNDSGAGAPAIAVLPGPGVETAAHESLNKKMGMVWRAVGYGLGLATNCNVWFLDAEQEKLLGEAYGDLCAHFGIADTLAFKIVFCVGTTTGIMGAKAAVYSAFRASQIAKEEKAQKELKDTPKQPEKPAAPPGPKDGHAPPPGMGAM